MAFVIRVSEVLDTPSKMTLWSFILPLLSTPHREYVLDNVHLPEGVVDYKRENTTPYDRRASRTPDSQPTPSRMCNSVYSSWPLFWPLKLYSDVSNTRY